MTIMKNANREINNLIESPLVHFSFTIFKAKYLHKLTVTFQFVVDFGHVFYTNLKITLFQVKENPCFT